jgi:hypothetical protein
MFSSGGWLWYVGAILLLSGVGNLAQVAGVYVPSKGGATGSLGLAAAGFIIGALVLIGPVLRWRQQVELFERGFVWTRLLGTHRVRREDIRHTDLITHHGRAASYVEVIVHLTSGRELSMEGLDHAEQLANMLSAYSRPMIQPAQAAATRGWTPPVI